MNLRRHKVLMFLIMLNTILGIGALYYFNDNDDTEPQEQQITTTEEVTFMNDLTGLVFQYTRPLKSQTLTDEDKTDGFIGRLETEDPAMIVSVRYEEGLRAAASLTGQGIAELISSNAAKVFPGRFPDYTLISENNFSSDGLDGKELVFTYEGPSNQSIKQRYLIIPKNGDSVVLVSMQSPLFTYDDANNSFFDTIVNSIDFN